VLREDGPAALNGRAHALARPGLRLALERVPACFKVLERRQEQGVIGARGKCLERGAERADVLFDVGGMVDFRAQGITFYDESNPNAKPEEWLTGAEYNIGLERIKTKEDLVKRLFNVDMWQMLQQIERDMTAYEVASRKAEKTSAISPSFYRKQPEFFNIIMPRVFGLLFRAGEFGPAAEVPQELLSADGTRLTLPRVVLTGKLAQAMRESENNSANAWLQSMLPLAQVAGLEVLDPMDLQKYSAGSAKNLGVPVEWQRSEADIRRKQDERVQQVAQAQALQATAVGAKAAGDMGKAPPALKKQVLTVGRG